jgi:membrane fusion protein (multidrug efflux system)
LTFVCSGASAQDNKVVPVEAAKVIAAPLSEQVTAIGTLLSNEAVTVSSEIPGRLKEIHFQEGQPVEKGVPLFTLDDSVYRAQLADAEAKLKLAEQTHQRRTALLTNKFATAQSADESASNLAVSTAAVELARAQLEKAHIVAPFAGIVGLRHVSVGEYITSGQALVNLEAIDPVKADFRVPEKFLPAIRVGQTIRIKVDAFPDATFEGKVYAIDPRLDVSGRSLLVRALVPNNDQLLRPGLFARVTVLLQLKEEALSVPEQAIVPQGDSQYVFKIVDGKVKFTKVVTGTRREGRVEIVEGLAVGDQVVTAGQLKIRDGSAVSIANGTGA